MTGVDRSDAEEGAQMPKGYVIITEDIHDPEGMAAYSKVSGGSLAEFGGRPLVVDASVEVIEGTWPGTRTIVIEFESPERAREWYGSASYQAALPLRLAAAASNAIVATGVEPRTP
jgi:uncharacterized protein (DUF1330 family)